MSGTDLFNGSTTVGEEIGARVGAYAATSPDVLASANGQFLNAGPAGAGLTTKVAPAPGLHQS